MGDDAFGINREVVGRIVAEIGDVTRIGRVRSVWS